MKTIQNNSEQFRTISLKTSLLALFFAFSFGVHAQLQLDSNGNVHVDYETDSGTSLMFGSGTNGQWALEHADGGLNFWRPYPLSSYGNYKFFIKDDGKIGVGKIPGGYGSLELLEGTTNGLVIHNTEYATFRLFQYNGTGFLTRSGTQYKGIAINTNGYIGINQPSPIYWLDVNGHARIDGQIFNSSDISLKEDIELLTGKTEKLKNLNSYQYKYKSKNKNKKKLKEGEQEELADDTPDLLDGRVHFGFIAQEVQELFPELVDTGVDSLLSVNYIGVIPILVEAFKEQQQMIEDLQEQLNGDEKDNKTKKTSVNDTGNTDLLEETVITETKLYQNTPNPFTDQTVIKYEVPTESKKGLLYIMDMNGRMLETRQLTTGMGEIIINAYSLQAGMYLYSLVVDGQIMDTKKMLITE